MYPGTAHSPWNPGRLRSWENQVVEGVEMRQRIDPKSLLWGILTHCSQALTPQRIPGIEYSTETESERAQIYWPQYRGKVRAWERLDWGLWID